jgi:hypothetical protein
MDCCQTQSCATPGEIGWHYISPWRLQKLLPEHYSQSNWWHDFEVGKKIVELLLKQFYG